MNYLKIILGLVIGFAGLKSLFEMLGTDTGAVLFGGFIGFGIGMLIAFLLIKSGINGLEKK